MTHGSLFSGIGGFDLAARWMGWENIFHCEKEPFCQKVLKYHFPKAASYSDITKTDFKKYEKSIDVLSGGFPCQPFSAAGRRKGTEDDRHLWPEMLRAIREIKPSWVVAENVRGLLTIQQGMVFEQVCADLENEGYKTQTFNIPACSKNAPHKRERLWIVAHCASKRFGTGCNNREKRQIQRNKEWNTTQSKSERERWQHRNSKNGKTRATTNTDSKRLQGQLQPNSNDKKRWEKQGRPIEQPTSDVRRTLSTKTWQNFPIEPPLCGRNDGISKRLDGITFPKLRVESIKAYGNAIVPQIAYEIFKAIQKHQNQ